MRRVLSKRTKEEVVISSNLEDLMERFNYIGFEPTDAKRYMIVRKGSNKGLALNLEGTWVTREFQREYPMELYVVFDSAKELYLWLAEGEINE